MGTANFIARDHHHERMQLRELPQLDFKAQFCKDVAAGLAEKPKRLLPKYFYDEIGSQYFEAITRSPEYYPTRTEAALLYTHAEGILNAVGAELGLVELGSGSSTKTRLLLDALLKRQGQLVYTPIDISPAIIIENGAQLLEDYPSLRVDALVCDYHQAMQALQIEQERPRLFLFLGSSLCNFPLDEAVRLLQQLASTMAAQDRLLLGLDLKKEAAIMEAAYNDKGGTSAAFNLNVLSHINRELGGHFDLSLFHHKAFFNATESRIEMHLESREAQIVPIDALKRSYTFQKEETIHTENSYKHDPAALNALYAGTGLKKVQRWSDENNWYALDLLAPT